MHTSITVGQKLFFSIFTRCQFIFVVIFAISRTLVNMIYQTELDALSKKHKAELDDRNETKKQNTLKSKQNSKHATRNQKSQPVKSRKR